MNKYIPVEKMSLRQYRKYLKQGYWGGKEDSRIVKIIKNNKDNPYV